MSEMETGVAENGRLYKLLAHDGRPAHGGIGVWPLPRDTGPGDWYEVPGKLWPCLHGLHLARAGDILRWGAPTLYRAEYDGEMIETAEKVVVRRARLLYQVDGWNERTLRLFAAACAVRVLSVCEDARPEDARPRAAIDAARRYAYGIGTPDEIALAAEMAVAAERVFQSETPGAAKSAALAAAWAAEPTCGWTAAASTAKHALLALLPDRARVAERAWQTRQLMMRIGEPL